jgi:hypothetical protein
MIANQTLKLFCLKFIKIVFALITNAGDKLSVKYNKEPQTPLWPSLFAVSLFCMFVSSFSNARALLKLYNL